MTNSERKHPANPTADRERGTHWQPGHGSPIDYLIACFAEKATADEALAQLIAAGFSGNALVVLDGPAAYEELLRAEARDARYRFTLAFEELFSDPRIQRTAYYDELRDGHAVLLVHAQGAEEKERALTTVKEAGGYHLSYRGRWLHEQIP